MLILFNNKENEKLTLLNIKNCIFKLGMVKQSKKIRNKNTRKDGN